MKTTAVNSGRSAKIATPTRSSILTSQLTISRWHEQIGDPTIADGILPTKGLSPAFGLPSDFTIVQSARRLVK